VLARAPSSQNLDAMIHRVAHDHAALFVHHHPTERVLEMAVAAAFLADDTHVRPVSVPQNVNSMRAVLDDHNVDAAVKRKA